MEFVYNRSKLINTIEYLTDELNGFMRNIKHVLIKQKESKKEFVLQLEFEIDRRTHAANSLKREALRNKPFWCSKKSVLKRISDSPEFKNLDITDLEAKAKMHGIAFSICPHRRVFSPTIKIVETDGPVFFRGTVGWGTDWFPSRHIVVNDNDERYDIVNDIQYHLDALGDLLEKVTSRSGDPLLEGVVLKGHLEEKTIKQSKELLKTLTA